MPWTQRKGTAALDGELWKSLTVIQHCQTDALTNDDGLAECVRCGATYAGLGLELEVIS